MRARRIERALRFAVPALAVASVAAAGASVAALARADELPCDEALAAERAGTPLPCEEAVPSPPPPTETGAATEPPAETAPAVTPPPAPTDTTPAAPAPPEPPATATTSGPAPEQPAPATTNPATGVDTVTGGSTSAAEPQSGTPQLAGGPYVFPVLGPASFTDTWGAPRATVAWHHGVDIFAPHGTPVLAVADGVLFSVGWNRIGGRRLWLRDREGNFFYYAHLSGFAEIAIDEARVAAGTVIGYVGDTGDAEGTSPHLHFEIHPVSLLSLGYDGAVDPFPYVTSWRRLDRALDLTTAPGQAATSVAAPAAGAFLLGFRDISSASGLSAGSLARTLEQAAAVEEPEQSGAAVTRRLSIRPPRAGDAQIARLLDSEASRPAPYGVGVWDALAACESGRQLGHRHGQRLQRRPPVPPRDVGLTRRDGIRPVRPSRHTRAADRSRRPRAPDPGLASVAGVQLLARASGDRRALGGQRASRGRNVSNPPVDEAKSVESAAVRCDIGQRPLRRCATDDENVEAHGHLVVRCAWCNRFLTDDGSWVNPSPELAARASGDGGVSHAICPTCFGREQPGGIYPG